MLFSFGVLLLFPLSATLLCLQLPLLPPGSELHLEFAGLLLLLSEHLLLDLLDELGIVSQQVPELLLVLICRLPAVPQPLDLNFHVGDPLVALVGEVLPDEVQLLPLLLPELLFDEVIVSLLLPGQLHDFVLELLLLVLRLLVDFQILLLELLLLLGTGSQDILEALGLCGLFSCKHGAHPVDAVSEVLEERLLVRVGQGRALTLLHPLFEFFEECVASLLVLFVDAVHQILLLRADLLGHLHGSLVLLALAVLHQGLQLPLLLSAGSFLWGLLGTGLVLSVLLGMWVTSAVSLDVEEVLDALLVVGDKLTEVVQLLDQGFLLIYDAVAVQVSLVKNLWGL